LAKVRIHGQKCLIHQLLMEIRPEEIIVLKNKSNELTIKNTVLCVSVFLHVCYSQQFQTPRAL